jgi:type IV secretory pathway VirB4 component
LWRQSVLGRQAWVVDPKGEYGPLAGAWGVEPIRLRPGGSIQLNPLDLGVETGRASLLASLGEASLGRRLAPRERSALELALKASEQHPVPTLPMVVDALLNPSPAYAMAISTDVATLLADGRDLALELRRMVHGDLAGMFDQPTTQGIDLDAPLVVLDLSAVYGSSALGILMTCATAWLGYRSAAHDGQLRLFVVDEAWAILSNLGVARWLQSAWKLSRARGVANIAVLHHLSDLAATGTDGSEAVKLAQGLLADSETVVSYAQPRAELERSAQLLGLTGDEAELLPQLGKGISLWKVGRRSFLVEHYLSDFERELVDTDADMAGRRS